MLSHKSYRGRKQLLRYSYLPAPHMQEGIVVQGEIQTTGMRQPPGQRDGLLAPGQCLVRIPKPPQPPARTREAYDSRVRPTAERKRMALLGVIESNALFQMRLCCDEIAHDE